DAPDGAKQTDVRAGRAHGRQKWQALLELLFLAGNGYAHGAIDPVHHRIGINTLLLAQAGKLLEAGAKDLLDAGIGVGIATRLTVQFGQIDTRPEALFESIQRPFGGTQQVAALEN